MLEARRAVRRPAARARARRGALPGRHARALPAAARRAGRGRACSAACSAARSRSTASPSTAASTPTGDVRPMGAEQSNSSIVFGDELVLKVFRRLEPGVNPELEMLRFLSARELPEHRGARRLVRVLGRAHARDARHPAGVRRRARATAGSSRSTTPHGLARAHRRPRRARPARCTASWPPTPSDPAFAPEEPSDEALSLLTATIDEQIERVFLDLPRDNPALEPIAGRGEEVRERLQLMSHVGVGGRLIRHHGDYHLGQTLLARRPLDHPRLRGRARALAARAPPQALAAARRRRDAALVRLRRVGVAAACAACPRPTGWEEQAREDFLEAYLEAVDPSLLPAGRPATEKLLPIFELEKAVYELRYELNNRPDWVPIPVAGIARLLESEVTDHERRHRHRPARRPRAPRPARRARRARVRGRRRRPRAAPGGRDGRRRSRPASSSTRVHPAGLFEGVVEDATLPLRYELEVAYPAATRSPSHDPYRFAPTLSDMDEHLFREGRHEQLWTKMGAHVREIDGVRRDVVRRLGARRALGRRRRRLQLLGGRAAPDARARRLGHLGALHPRRRPRARTTSSRSARRTASCRQKADPFAFETELPPQTASIVHRSTFEWTDAEYLAARRDGPPLGRPMSIYEVHLGSWRLNPLEGNRSLTYAELADELAVVRVATSASRTSSCCRSWATRSAGRGATR